MSELSILNHDASQALFHQETFNHMQKVAEMIAKTFALPEHLRGKPADCMRVVEMAMRIGQSPYALADGSYITGGKLSFDGKTIAAIINSHKKIDGNLDFKYEGDKNKPEQYFCTVIGKLKIESASREIKVSLAQGIADSTKKQKDGTIACNPRWKKDPDQMLAYYGARVWARRHAPEVIGGLYSCDELDEYIEIDKRTKRPLKTVDPISPPVVIAEEEKDPAEALAEKLDYYLTLIQGAQTVKELQKIYTTAFNWAKSTGINAYLDAIIEAKNARKAQLETQIENN